MGTTAAGVVGTMVGVLDGMGVDVFVGVLLGIGLEVVVPVDVGGGGV